LSVNGDGTFFLYKKKQLHKANKNGSYTSQWLEDNVINPLFCSLVIKTYLPNKTEIRFTLPNRLIVTAPTITSVEKVNSEVVIKGKYFGSKRPCIWLEDRKGAIEKYGPIVKYRLRVKRIYKYANARGMPERSCMDIFTGESEIRVKMSVKWWKGWESGDYGLVLSNRSGLDTTSVSTVD
jgi:hypothetical protein